MADLTVSARLQLDTQEFEKGVERADQAGEKLSGNQRRRSQFDIEGSSTVAKTTEAANTATSNAATAANQATEAAAKRAVAESQVATAVRGGSDAVKAAIANDNIAASATGFLARLGLAAGAVGVTVLALTAMAGVVVEGTKLAEAAEQRQRQFTLSITASGNAAGTTATALERLVKAEAMRVGIDRQQAGAAVGELALNPNLDENRIARTLALSTDFARITGEQLPAAAANLNKALDGTVASARSLDLTWNFLTASELAQIRQLEEHGNKAGIVGVVLTAMERNFKGANENGVSPLTKGLSDLGAAWTVFETKIGQSPVIQKLLAGTGAALSAIGSGLNSLTGGPADGPSAASLKTDLAQAQAQLARAEEQLQLSRSATGRAAIDPTNPRTNGLLQAQEERVAKLRANVEELKQKVDTVTSTQVEGQVAIESQANVTQYERQLKDFGDRLQAANTVSQQREKVQAALDEAQYRVRQGGLSPEQLAAVNQQITTLKGSLYTLLTPTEQLQKNLDLQAKLAALPPALRPVAAAMQAAFEQARAAGNSPDEARKIADKAGQVALAERASGTAQQISLLSAEAQGALAVADAYGKSRAAGLRQAAEAAAQAAELAGTIAAGTAGAVAQETLEKNASAAVTASAEKNRSYQEELAALGRLVAAEAISVEAAREAERVNRVAALSIQLRAQAESAGGGAIAAAAERQISAYDQLSQRQLTLDRQRAAQQLNTSFDPDRNFAQRMAQLAQLQTAGVLTERAITEATRKYQQEQLDASRKATEGMQAGLKHYADDATNLGKQASQAVQNGFKSMEDALVQFVTTGQLNFTNLANAIIADLARIAIRAGITGPLAAGLGSIFGKWFGGGDDGDGPADGVGPGTGEIYHAGGIVGVDGGPSRDLPLSAWDGARRYHKGGMVLAADEVPIIARKGERVLTEEQQRAWDRGGSGAGGGIQMAGGIQVNIINNAGAKVSTKQGSTAGGAPKLDVILDQVEEAIAGNILRQRGPMRNAMESTYGLQAVGR